MRGIASIDDGRFYEAGISIDDIMAGYDNILTAEFDILEVRPRGDQNRITISGGTDTVLNRRLISGNMDDHARSACGKEGYDRY